jgi:hypothetical protein
MTYNFKFSIVLNKFERLLRNKYYAILKNIDTFF